MVQPAGAAWSHFPSIPAPSWVDPAEKQQAGIQAKLTCQCTHILHTLAVHTSGALHLNPGKLVSLDPPAPLRSSAAHMRYVAAAAAAAVSPREDVSKDHLNHAAVKEKMLFSRKAFFSASAWQSVWSQLDFWEIFEKQRTFCISWEAQDAIPTRRNLSLYNIRTEWLWYHTFGIGPYFQMEHFWFAGGQFYLIVHRVMRMYVTTGLWEFSLTSH